MLFRSAAVLTTLACVVASFAIPLVDPVSNVPGSGLSTGHVVERQLDPSVLLNPLGGTTAGAAGVSQVRRQEENAEERRQEESEEERRQEEGEEERRQEENAEERRHNAEVDVDVRAAEHPTLPDIFQGACAELIPITNQLRSCIGVDVAGDIDVELIVKLLGQIIFVLKGVLVDVTYILQNPAGFVLSLGGKVLGIAEVGLVVGTLVNVVVTVVAVVLRTVVVSVHGSVLPLVNEIGGLLAQILVIVLRIVPGLLTHVNAAVAATVADILFLHYTDLVACLHLFALAH